MTSALTNIDRWPDVDAVADWDSEGTALAGFILEHELRGLLLAAPAIAAIVANRIYPEPAPQNAVMPFITFSRVTAQRVYSLLGYSGLAGPLIQIDCWTDCPEYRGTYGESLRLAREVRLLLDGYIGPIGIIPRADIMLETERDLFDRQDMTRRVSIDFRIWHDDYYDPAPAAAA